MKILHIVPTYWPAYKRGGPIWSVHNLNKWLARKGVDVTVYTTDIDVVGKVSVNQEVFVDGVKVWYFPLTWRPWQYSCGLHKQLKKTLKDFDLIHITSTFLFASTLGAYYAKKFNKPFIISPRGNLMVSPLLKKSPLKKKVYLGLIERQNLKSASAIHFTTEAEKQEYLLEKLPFKKSIVIPNGLDPEKFGLETIAENKVNFRYKFNLQKDKRIILSLGRINWKKGFDTLIPAFAEVIKKEPNTVLVIAGGDDEGYKKEVKRQIIDSKLQDNKVIFTGMLLDEDRIAAYKESQVFMLPSYSENFGMAVVEAMYFALPVVITKYVGIAPFVEEAKAGLVVQKDPESVARAILEILQNPDSKKIWAQMVDGLLKGNLSCRKLLAVGLRFIEN